MLNAISNGIIRSRKILPIVTEMSHKNLKVDSGDIMGIRENASIKLFSLAKIKSNLRIILRTNLDK